MPPVRRPVPRALQGRASRAGLQNLSANFFLSFCPRRLTFHFVFAIGRRRLPVHLRAAIHDAKCLVLQSDAGTTSVFRALPLVGRFLCICLHAPCGRRWCYFNLECKMFVTCSSTSGIVSVHGLQPAFVHVLERASLKLSARSWCVSGSLCVSFCNMPGDCTPFAVYIYCSKNMLCDLIGPWVLVPISRKFI